MFSALLDPCHHTREWRHRYHTPNVGDVVFCPRCQMERAVLAVIGPWHCLCIDCRLSARGQLETTVVTHARRHLRIQSAHRLRIWQYGRSAQGYIVSKQTTARELSLF